ncbi:MAG: inositol monophosphatase [Pseudomonadota bacterium]
MKFTAQLDVLTELVRSAALEILMPRFRQVQASLKQDGSLVTEADLLLQQRIAGELKEQWPEIAFLGEEMPASEQAALLKQRDAGLWVLDPLDGTINFASGVPNFAVSLALLDADGVNLGIIYDPCRDELFSATRGNGAILNGQPLQLPQDKSMPLAECVAEIDLKRLDLELRIRLVSSMPFRSQRNFGSGALDWAWLADGRYQLYLHGGQKLWDYAAGSLILAEAGGSATTLDNRPLLDGGIAPRSVVGAVTPELHRSWLEWLAECSS